MFGGLEIKGESDKKEEEESSAPAAPATSGFSFLSSASASASSSTPADDSGFGFLKEKKDESTAALQSKEEPASDPPPPASGFSFLSSVVGLSAATVNDDADVNVNVNTNANAKDYDAAQEDQEDSKNEEQNQSEETSAAVNPPVPVSSGFSFLSSVITPATQIIQPEDAPLPPAPVSLHLPSPADGASNGHGAGSMFSMLNLKTEEPLPPIIKSDPLTSSSTDILSLANPKQPTGSGIVFGGAAKPKVVKKRSRTKKIGAATTTAAAASLPPHIPKPTHTNISANDNANTNASANINANININTKTNPPVPETMEHSQPQTPEEKRMFRKLTDEANQAATRAEEFINSKQSSSYMGRYSKTDTIEEDYGDAGNTNANVNFSTPGKKEDSEDYKKAKAAAQEAMKKETTLRKIGFSAGFSGFFKRNLGASGESGSVAPEEEVAVAAVDKKEEEPMRMQVPTYGESNAPLESSEKVYELESERVQERLRQEEEREMQRRYSEEVDEKRRLEVERQEESRRVVEERRLEEERLVELELEQEAHAEEERRQKEAEEAARRTPHQRLQQILNEFAAKSQDATLAVAALRQERSTMQGKRALAEKQERFATQQISQAEKQQMEAAEQEEFELADQLAAVIEQHQREQEEKSQIFENVIGLIEDLDYKRLDVVKGVWQCFENIQKELKIFFAEQDNSDITDSSELMKKFENDTRKLAAENERLSADLKNIERDEDFVKQEREELETNIHEQTFGIEELHDVAIEKLDGINAEIDELRRQLESKEMEAAEVKLELHGQEDSIEQVRTTFSRQLTRLAKKDSAVKESRNEWLVEDSIYKKARKEHESEVTSHSEALVAHDRIISQVKEEILVAGELAKIIAQEVVVEKSTDPQDIDDELRKVQAEALQLEAAADEASQVLAAAKTYIDGLKDELSTIEVRLPILESEKKLAAAKRDFRAAANASKEIKEIVSRKDKCNEELEGEASQKREAAQKTVEEALEALDEKKAKAHVKEKESGSKRMIDLVKNIINLEKLRESVCGIDEGEMDNVKSVGGFVLDSEISALMMEGDELDQKYGGWNDIMLEYASKENEDEESGTVAAENEPSSVESEEIVSTDEEGDDCIESEDGAAGDEDIDSRAMKEEAMVTYKTMAGQLDDLESKLELAIENEEYEDATELDDQISALKYGIDALALSDDEKEVALLATSNDDVEVTTSLNVEVPSDLDEAVDEDPDEHDTQTIQEDSEVEDFSSSLDLQNNSEHDTLEDHR